MISECGELIKVVGMTARKVRVEKMLLE